MIFAIAGARPARLVVLAYDIGCQRRASRARKVLAAVHHAKQYSVFEAVLTQGAFNGVLAELSACCDLSTDLLAAWWPAGGLRLAWQDGRLGVAARAGEPCREPAALRPNLGNFVLCYDISDRDALNAVAGEVAREAVMVQRSVYWLRMPAPQLADLLGRCARHLDEADRLWAYPLAGASDLWRIGAPSLSILPISTHRWRTS